MIGFGTFTVSQKEMENSALETEDRLTSRLAYNEILHNSCHAPTNMRCDTICVADILETKDHTVSSGADQYLQHPISKVDAVEDAPARSTEASIADRSL